MTGRAQRGAGGGWSGAGAVYAAAAGAPAYAAKAARATAVAPRCRTLAPLAADRRGVREDSAAERSPGLGSPRRTPHEWRAYLAPAAARAR